MSLDPLLPVAPATVKALLLPLGKIKAERFASFADRLRAEHVVHLRDISADSRPYRNMFSPLAYPDGAMLYDLITHQPPPPHLALSPFDLYREPLAILALADGTELLDASFTKRHSASGSPATVLGRNIRALYQELESLRDSYPKALVHQVIIFDYLPLAGSDIPMPEGVVPVPPAEHCKRTTMKTVMCDISSLLLAEMTTMAKSFEAMTAIESPGKYSIARHMNGGALGGEGEPANGMLRRNSQLTLPQPTSRPSSAAGGLEKNLSRMSMPPLASHPPLNSSYSTPARPSTPVRGGLASIPMSPDDASSRTSSPEQKSRGPDSDSSRDASRDRVAVQGFGPGSANDRWRLRDKGRTSVVLGSMYLQAGRWSDSLKELGEAAVTSRSLNDHVWYAKAMELILINLFLLAWSKLDFQVPAVCLPPQKRPGSLSAFKPEPEAADPAQPKHMRQLQNLLPELLDRIVGFYTRISSESLPPLPLSETIIRFCKILSAMHLCGGKLNQQAIDMIVGGRLPEQGLTMSPRLTITPSRQHIVNLLFRAFPSSATELLTTADRVSVLSGIAAVLGPLGYQRKKAMVIRELVSVLIGGLVDARTRGAEAGVHPTAGLLSLAPVADRSGGVVTLDLSKADIEHGLEAFLELLCNSYGIIGFETRKRVMTASEDLDDSDEAVIARIIGQSSTRSFGFTSIKLNILRACINFSEALPDFHGVLKFSSDLMRTAGSGVAPGSRREDAAPMIHRDEQVCLATNISRTASLVQKIGMGHMTAEYWDEFLVRSVTLDPPPTMRAPIPHSRSALPGATASRASQDVDPFIYNPFLKEPDEAAAQNLVAGELATFRVTLQNTYEIKVEIESMRLCTEGVDFEAMTEKTLVLGPYRTQLVRLRGRPREPGSLKVTGAMVQVRGCREIRFPILTKPWTPSMPDKIKAKGLAALEGSEGAVGSAGGRPEPRTLSLNVIQPQPLVVIKSTTLPQSSVMILEGERQTFSVTMQNTSQTPVDMMLFSFKDSTQAPLQEALNRRDATPAELHEYELIFSKRQALRLPQSDQARSISSGGEATFDFEILGKPGLTSATIQVDYTHLGVPRDEVTEQFYTRQVSLDLTVTVNASVELTRVDALPVDGGIPQPLWERTGRRAPADADEAYCLLCMDLHNAWPSHMAVHLEGEDGVAVDEEILPGKTSRVVIPVRRVYLEDPHESIPSLNPSRKRQFVVSASNISPDMERANREAFWYRERILDRLRAIWRTTSAPKRSGAVELRNMRLTSRMMEAIKVDEVGIDVTVEEAGGGEGGARRVAYVDDLMQLRVRISNRTARPIYPLVRLMPALCHRPPNVALDFTRKFAWNGTLQQQLPELPGHGATDLTMGVTALCRGEFELTASVEEVQVWEAGSKGDGAAQEGRPRSDTQRMDAALGVCERRMWHTRRPCTLTVVDREDGLYM